MKSPSMLRAEYHAYVDQMTHLPKHIKHHAKDIISSHFQAMSKTLGALQLLYLRETQHRDEEKLK